MWVLPAGGSALAQKLVDIYFTLFKLILEGKLGHGSELAAVREAKANAKHGKRGKKGPPEHARPRAPGAAGKKAPSSADQVILAVQCNTPLPALATVARKVTKRPLCMLCCESSSPILEV